MRYSRHIHRKIDPELLKSMRTMSQENTSVILYSMDHHRCREHVESMGLTIKQELPFIDAFVIEAPYERLEELAAHRHVQYVAADISVKTQMNIASQEVGAPMVNESGYTGRGIGIAFIDTGIYPHNDFIYPENRIKYFKDYVNEKKSPYDDNGHGSFVAGVAAGNGYSSQGRYKGIAPEADIISLKTMDEDGGGKSSDILAAMQWISNHHEEYNIRVVSMSLGSEPGKLAVEDPLARGANALWRKGMTVVAAAGNSGPDPRTITTPGTSSRVITVGAVDDKRTVEIKDDAIADFSSRGPVGRITKPDVVAPGVKVTSVNSDTEYVQGVFTRYMVEPYTTMSGTSVATPLVAGAAALILQKNPEWSPDQVKDSLMKNAVKIADDVNMEGRGLINLPKSLEL